MGSLRRALAGGVAACSLLLAAGVAEAQVIAGLVVNTAAPITFHGPGDIITTFQAAGGLLPLTFAQANAGTTHLIKLRRPADGHTCEILGGLTSGVLKAGLTNTVSCSTGGDNGTNWKTWATRNASLSMAISGTTGTTTGDPCTAQVGDVISAANFASYLVRIGTVTSCSAGVGSYALTVDTHGQSALSISAEAVTDFYGLFGVTSFDISGHTNCSAAACNVTQATTGQQPQFIPVGCANPLVNNGPCFKNTNASSTRLNSVGTFATQAIPFSHYSVFEYTPAAPNSSVATFTYDGTNGAGVEGGNFANGYIGMQATNSNVASISGPASAGNYNITHTVLGTVKTSGASGLTVSSDGTNATVTSAATQSAGVITVGGIASFDADDLDGEWVFWGIASGDQSGKSGTMCHNDKINLGVGPLC